MIPEKEDSIKSWILEIQAWGFPSRVAQLREMGEELLQAKGENKLLRKNWFQEFLYCYPTLQTKYSYTLNQDWFLPQNRDIIHD